jgi:hypothetical protein
MRFFVLGGGATLDEMVARASLHGEPIAARGYQTPHGLGIYGATEIAIPPAVCICWKLRNPKCPIHGGK